jgi:hypothetical protein
VSKPVVTLSVVLNNPLFSTRCLHCDQELVATIKSCGEVNRVAICSCGNSVLASSRTESPQTVLSRAVQTLACEDKVFQAVCTWATTEDCLLRLPWALAWIEPEPKMAERGTNG